MKDRKPWQIALLVIVCILVNIAGRAIANRFNLFLWLDSFGTVASAYLLGALSGCMVGVTGNLICSVLFHTHWVYLVTSIAIALLVGLLARKRWLDSFLGTMGLGLLCAFIAAAISVPLNYIMSDGMTGNIWGDGVINLLRQWGWPYWLSIFTGEFYLEFADKIITLFAVFFAIKAYRRFRRSAGKSIEDAASSLSGKTVLILCVLSCALAAASPAEADSSAEFKNILDYNDYVQTVYSNDNGLPCGEANDIEETNDGILWIGTYAGLYRYNGQEFEWMDDFGSVRNVNCLYTDREGRLWIGTNDNGLAISINETIVNMIDQESGLPSNSVRCIAESSDGYYYIGTTGSMQILTLNSGLKKVCSLWEVNYADNVSVDQNGHAACVTSDGRLFLMRKGQILCSLQIPGNEEFINCCEFDRNGRLLAGTSSGRLIFYDISEDRFDKITDFMCDGLTSLNDLNLIENGEVFISAENGIGYLDIGGSYHRININEFNNSIDNMLIDYQGNLWFASSRLGLLRLAPSPFRDIYSTVGLESHVVNSVTKWMGNYYIGTDAGLDIVDGACRGQILNSLTTQLKRVRIRCLYADTNDHLWICTYGQGLWEVEPDGNITLYDSENGGIGNRSRLVTELSDGTIAAGGDTGVSFIRDHQVLQTIGYADGLINSMVLSISELPDGRIIVGTDGDGLAIIVNGEVTRMLTRADGLSSGVILRTIVDEKGGGVFLVTSNGLCYMDAHGTIRTLDNFPYFNNYDIWIRDGDTLFVTGSSGIYVVDREELLSGTEKLSYDLLDSRAGLQSALTANSWNYYEGGNMFLSCDSGVYIADIDNYSSDSRAYRMNLSYAYLDGNEFRIEGSTPLSIDRSVRKIELFPEVVNYSILDPNVGYRLEGFDDDWTIVPHSNLGTITYTNVPSGTYTFRIAVFGSDESAILKERDYTLVKEEDIYDKPWFLAYVVIGLMAFIVFIFAWWFKRMYDRAQLQIQMGNETIQTIANTVDAKDVRTNQHSYRVSEYAKLIGQKMGFGKKECENLRRAAQLHDIGKIAIPDAILNKPARLTDEEYAIMKSHTVRGAKILEGFTLIEHVKDGALYHHERYDGRGYPQGIKGEDIPKYGRIIGVADAFDAMTANRVYRNQMDMGYVLNELRNGRGTQFDPEVVDVFLKILEEGTIDINKLYSAQKSEGSKAAEEKKAEEKKPEEKKPDGNKPDEKDEKKPEKKADGTSGGKE